MRAASSLSRHIHVWKYVCVISALWLMHATAHADFTGQPSVHDGDTVTIAHQKIRFFGIDAPELSQSCTRPNGELWQCGEFARDALTAQIADRDVRCVAKDQDRYGRVVGECFAGTTNLNQWMVRNGWAYAYRSYSRQFIPDEQAAKRAHLGIWNSTCRAPWEWRRAERGQPPRAAAATDSAANTTHAGCDIKGNVNAQGARIYHLPGSRFYAQTQINESTGERWFCTEHEAAAAGFRASHN